MVNVAYETLLECQNGPKGFELELKAENQTRTIVGEGQRLRFVPYVVYDRVSLDYLPFRLTDNENQ